MRSCIFVAAGDISERYFDALMQLDPKPFVFAIDGGYAFLKKKGVNPDIAIGDFDSLGFVPEEPETEVFPVRKDKPDTMLAIDRAKELMFDVAYVLGGFGGDRLDHTYSNIQQLFYALPALRLFFLDEKALVFALGNETLELSDGEMRISSGMGAYPSDSFFMPEQVLRVNKPSEAYLSLFTQELAVVDLEGTAYNGCNIRLTGGFPLGVSNEMTEERCTVNVRGHVIVMLCGKRN
jgi:thiamine pyrophosphokinase